jgi:hypothetical protein
MEDIKRIGGINLAILVGYMLLINITSTGPERGLGVAIFAAMAIIAHVAITGLIAIVFFIQKKRSAPSYLLSAVLVLVIGFSACLGSLMFE